MHRALIICFLACSLRAAVLPTDRIGDWTGNVGVSGGIPVSSNMSIFTNLSAGVSAAVINSVIQACPSNQVVQLSSGDYNLSSQVLLNKSGVVLRGVGTNTVLNFTAGSVNIYGGGWYAALRSDNYNGGAETTWTAGYDKGTTDITLGSVSGLTVGNILVLDALPDNFWVRTYGYEGNQQSGRDLSRAHSQMCEVVAINGSVVTISPALQSPIWSTQSSHQAYWIGASQWITRCGVENMTINGSNSFGSGAFYANVNMETARECWVRGIVSTYGYWSGVATYGAFRCEVRHNYFFGTQGAGTQSYGVTAAYCWGGLIEDNVMEKIVAPLVTSDNCMFTVVAYNYTTNNYYAAANNFLMASFQPHAAHGYMNLFEGNHGNKITLDFIHGSGSHMTMFRNRLTGYELFSYPSGPTANNLQVIQVDLTNAAMSAVGNILGTDGIYSTYQSVATNEQAEPVIYDIGVENDAYGKNWGNDTNTFNTFYRHMDFDFATDSIVYNATNADVTLPASLYHTSKPAWFGFLGWGAYNPSNTTAAGISPTNIPAGYRHVFGSDPPAEGDSGGNTATATTVRAGTVIVRQ